MFSNQRASTRIIINTSVQYIRSIINIIVSLYSARLILNALGVSDFGIYSLIGGVVSLLSFLSNSLVITTQRFVSYHQVRSSLRDLKKIVSNSLLSHIFIALFIVLTLELLAPFLFNGLLNIPKDRIQASIIVYQCVIGMVGLSLVMSPFRALLIAHENIIYISIIEIVACFIKLAIALFLTVYGTEKLILYAELMVIIIVFELLFYAIYDFKNYEECCRPRLKWLNKRILKSMFGFASWTLWSQGCLIGRVQGVAIIINKFFGAAVNAAYGIGIQVNGAVLFISSSLSNAFNPQIIKAAGQENRDKMYLLAATYSKFAFLLLASVVTPLFIYCPLVLELWLGEVPEYSVLFCRVILLSSLVDLPTIGLGTANQAIGNIKNYSLYLNSIKLSTIPIILIFLLYDAKLEIAMWSYPIIETVVMLLRLPYMAKAANLNSKLFIKRTFIPSFIPIFCCISLYFISLSVISNIWQLMGSIIIISSIYCTTIYIFGLSPSEKLRSNEIIRNLYKKIHTSKTINY